MRLSMFVAFCSLSFSPIFACGQSTESTSRTPVRDSQAVAILTQALNASGGAAAVGKIQNMVGTGAVTYYWGHQNEQGNVTVKVLGLQQFREDANLADGLHSTVINGSNGFRKNPDGSTSQMPSKTGLRIANEFLPALYLFVSVLDESVNVSYAGLKTYDNRQAYDISVQKTFPSERDPLGALSKSTKAHIYVDPTNLLIRGILSTAYGKEDSRIEGNSEVRFSDYQAVQGVMTPMSITEFIAGQRTSSVQLKQVNFNRGLSNKDFEQ